MATELELKEITIAMQIAEAMADDRQQVIAVESDLHCRPQMKSRRVDIVETIRPRYSIYGQRLQGEP